MALIQTKNLSRVYKPGSEAETVALENASLNIEDGEYVAIMGSSGSGKSTLMHILGLLDRPSEGSYWLEGTDVSGYKDTQLANLRGRKIGFVFQNFNLLPRLSALENVALPMAYQGMNVKQRRDKAAEILARVGLEDRTDHTPNELSGGQKQRVALARALANDPSVILADEPTGNLDSKTGETILELFKQLHKDGRTIIIVTHDQELARAADRIIRIKDGVIGVEESS